MRAVFRLELTLPAVSDHGHFAPRPRTYEGADVERTRAPLIPARLACSASVVRSTSWGLGLESADRDMPRRFVSGFPLSTSSYPAWLPLHCSLCCDSGVSS